MDEGSSTRLAQMIAGYLVHGPLYTDSSVKNRNLVVRTLWMRHDKKETVRSVMTRRFFRHEGPEDERSIQKHLAALFMSTIQGLLLPEHTLEEIAHERRSTRSSSLSA